jgi:hypothetical protein
MFGDGSNPQVMIHEGGMLPGQYAHMLNSSKFCLAPSGYGWGIRLNYYVVAGCVPVIIQVCGVSSLYACLCSPVDLCL